MESQKYDSTTGVAESVGAIQNGRGGRDMRLERRGIGAVVAC